MTQIATRTSRPEPGGSVMHTPSVFQPARDLTGPQKAAIIVRLLLSQGAELPITGLPDHLQAAITEQIGMMRSIDRDTLDAVVEEFCTTLERVGLSFPGGIEGALKMLDGHISPTAASRLRRLAGASSKADPWDKIRTFDADRMLPTMQEESIEISAIILSKIAVPRAAELLGRLPGERARRIAYAMSQTANIDPEMVRKLGLALLGQLEVQPARAFEGDPVHRVGAILNAAPSSLRDDVLQGLEETDDSLAQQVRKTIFTFAHIPTRILPRDVPKFLRGIEQTALVIALGGAKGPMAEAADFILANVSQRMATTLREEIGGIGRFKEKDVETAQTQVVIAIRELVDAGEIVMIVDEEDEE